MEIVIDNNSLELHKELERIGFHKLEWTTNTGKPNLRTCVTNSYHTKDGIILAYWNDGTDIEKFKSSGVAVCCTIDEFVNKAKILINVI